MAPRAEELPDFLSRHRTPAMEVARENPPTRVDEHLPESLLTNHHQLFLFLSGVQMKFQPRK